MFTYMLHGACLLSKLGNMKYQTDHILNLLIETSQGQEISKIFRIPIPKCS